MEEANKIRLGYSIEPEPLEKYTEILHTTGKGDVKVIVDSLACHDDSEGKAMYTIDKLYEPRVLAVARDKVYTNYPQKDMDIDGVLMFETLRKRTGYPLVGIMRDPASPTMLPSGPQYVIEQGTNEYKKGCLLSLLFDTRYKYPKGSEIPLFIGSDMYIDPPGEVYYELRATKSPREMEKLHMEFEDTREVTLPSGWSNTSNTSNSSNTRQGGRSRSSSRGGSRRSSSLVSSQPTTQRRRVRIDLHSGCVGADRGVMVVLDRREDHLGDKPGDHIYYRFKAGNSKELWRHDGWTTLSNYDMPKLSTSRRNSHVVSLAIKYDGSSQTFQAEKLTSKE
jgi:hypothetical protein